MTKTLEEDTNGIIPPSSYFERVFILEDDLRVVRKFKKLLETSNIEVVSSPCKKGVAIREKQVIKLLESISV